MVKNAVITGAEIFIEDHGLLTYFLYLDYGNSSQGFGGYAIKLNAGWHISRILKVVGVSKWSDLKGKVIRADADFNTVRRIGNAIREDWFDPKEEMKEKDYE